MEASTRMATWHDEHDWLPSNNDNIVCVFANRRKEFPALRVFLIPECVLKKLNLLDQVVAWKSTTNYIEYGTREYYEGYYLAHTFKTYGVEINLNQIACFGFEHMIQIFVNDNGV
jgi:hypothetical protein